MASSVSGLDLLVQSHSPVSAPPRQPLSLAKPEVEGTNKQGRNTQTKGCTNLPACTAENPPMKPEDFGHMPLFPFYTPKFTLSIILPQISLQ